MADEQDEQAFSHVPDSPAPGAADDPATDDHKRVAKERKRADELAEKLAVGDELSGYEKVAARGVAED